MRKKMTILFLCSVCLAALWVLGFRLLTVQKEAKRPLPPGVLRCTPGLLIWHDAVGYMNSEEVDTTRPDRLLSQEITFGCIYEDEHSFLVVGSFSNGHPRDFTVVPKDGWAVRAVPLIPVPIVMKGGRNAKTP